MRVPERVHQAAGEVVEAALMETVRELAHALPDELVRPMVVVEASASALVCEAVYLTHGLHALGIGPDVDVLHRLVDRTYAEPETRLADRDGRDADRDLFMLTFYEETDCDVLVPGLRVARRYSKAMTDAIDRLKLVEFRYVPGIVCGMFATRGVQALARRSYVTREGAHRRVDLFWKLAQDKRLEESRLLS